MNMNPCANSPNSSERAIRIVWLKLPFAISVETCAKYRIGPINLGDRILDTTNAQIASPMPDRVITVVRMRWISRCSVLRERLTTIAPIGLPS